MDAHKFGAFIAENRKTKKMTQAELAEKLQVTDKAVSRWERGLGFPDINTLEPLAEALELSILELMKSEKTDKIPVSHEDAEKVIIDTLDVAIVQKREERKKVQYILMAAVAAVILLLLIDNIGWDIAAVAFLFFTVFLPIFGVVSGIGLIVYGTWRKAHHKPARQTFVMAAVCLVIAVIPFIAMIILALLGGFPMAS